VGFATDCWAANIDWGGQLQRLQRERITFGRTIYAIGAFSGTGSSLQ
jgi:hypothetical protein